jgi:hypothetical protein
MNKKLPSLLLLLFLHSPLFSQSDMVGSGRALRFDGVDDYVDLGNIYDDITLPMTISAWVYVEPSSQYILPIFVSQDNVSLYNGFWFCLSATNLFFEYGDGRGDQSSSFRRGRSASVSNLLSRWIYVSAVVTNGNNIQLYANGQNIGGAYTGASELPMSSDYPTDVAKIGYFFTNSVTHRFYGLIDELRIWNRALSEQELRQTMCTRLTGSENSLIGYWNFDETSGNVLNDLSANDFNGSLIGNPERVFSGAPIGDESSFLYTTSWAGKTLTGSELNVSKVTGNVYGVHTYVVNSPPSQTGGLNAEGTESKYSGIFLADDGGNNTFDFSFAEEVYCPFMRRNDNSEPVWQSSETFTNIFTRIEVVRTLETAGVEVDLGPDIQICDQKSYLLKSGFPAIPPGTTFLWNTGETTPDITVTTSGAYLLKSKGDCNSHSDTVYVSFLQSPPSFSLGDDEDLCSFKPRVLAPDIETDGLDLTWHDESKNSTFPAVDFGSYWLKVENSCGSRTDTITFTQAILTDLKSYNFISPDNNDDRNQFLVVDERLQGNHLTVFNRWGKPIFERSNYQSNWDGDGLPAGVYFYTIRGECFEPLKGTVTILR